MKKQQLYFISILTNTDKTKNYYVTEGKKGRALIIFKHDCFMVLTEKGWQKQEHKDFLAVEIADDQENVLVYYKKKKHPEKIAIPIVGPDVLKLKDDHIEKVVRQMKEDGLTYDDFLEEYYNGTNTTYGYNKQTGKYTVTKIDIVAASFFNVEVISVDELKSLLMKNASLHELREQGFDI